ncbi:hypothetical protein, partial [Klebsiella pneumoniae]|uniref:hypothetical protein n=1 Tax=Klebsiella pneumoniae TaxID=573 RepID=UPI001D11D906
ADRNRSHWSTSKTPSYTKSVSWQHHRLSFTDSIYHVIIVLSGLLNQKINWYRSRGILRKQCKRDSSESFFICIEKGAIYE